MATISPSGVENTVNNVATNVERKAEQAANALASKASAIGDKMSTVAGKIREKAPADGRLSSAAESVASGMERAGNYMREHDLRSVGNDLSDVIRRNPVPAALVGVGVGFILGRALMSRASSAQV
jgi:hypothetical protein